MHHYILLFAPNKKINCAIQKPPSINTEFTDPKICLRILSTKLAVFPRFSNSFGPHCQGRSLPSTICALKSIDVNPQQIVCVFPPKVRVLLPTQMKPIAYLLKNSITLSSRILTQEGLNPSYCFNSTYLPISSFYKNWSSQSTYSFMCHDAESIVSNQLWPKYSSNKNSAPLNIVGFLPTTSYAWSGCLPNKPSKTKKQWT